jgi:hypothetical protein
MEFYSILKIFNNFDQLMNMINDCPMDVTMAIGDLPSYFCSTQIV